MCCSATTAAGADGTPIAEITDKRVASKMPLARRFSQRCTRAVAARGPPESNSSSLRLDDEPQANHDANLGKAAPRVPALTGKTLVLGALGLGRRTRTHRAARRCRGDTLVA